MKFKAIITETVQYEAEICAPTEGEARGIAESMRFAGEVAFVACTDVDIDLQEVES